MVILKGLSSQIGIVRNWSWWEHFQKLKTYIMKSALYCTYRTLRNAVQYLDYRARIFKRLWSPGIDSKEWIPPAYVAWRAGTITLFLLGA
jgi:hypothetical protein